MLKMQIRDAIQADIRSIISLCQAGAVVPNRYKTIDLADPSYSAAFHKIDADPNHRLVVVEIDDQVVGTLHITFIPGLMDAGRSRGLLENVHIREDYRGQGIGQEMIEWAIEECRRADCHMVQLTSNKLRTDAHRFYRRLGFDNSHEGFKLAL